MFFVQDQQNIIMQSDRGFSARIYNTLNDRKQYKPINFYTSRPKTTYKSRNIVILQDRDRTDSFQVKRGSYQIRAEHSQIDFKRDKIAFQNKQAAIQHAIKSNKQRKQTTKSTIVYHPVIVLDNLKVSLKKYQQMSTSSNDIMKNIVRQQIISELQINNPFFRKFDKNLVQSLILIGKLKVYRQDQQLIKNEATLGFILYGVVKIYNKDYKNILEKGDVFGQHQLFKYNIRLSHKILEESCIFWLPIKYYNIVREQSYTHGLKEQFNRFEVALRRSFIAKKYKETLKKTGLV